MKECIGCHRRLPFKLFYTKSGRVNQYSSRCRECQTTDQRQYKKIYSKERYQKIKGTAAHKKYVSEYNKKYRKTAYYITYLKEYRKTPSYKNYKNEYQKNRVKTHPQTLLATRLRARVQSAMKRNSKTGSAIKEMGCNLTELKTYIENKFAPGMSWGNKNLWHIDHIRPLISFDLADKEQFLLACHYTNLQPLWTKENLVKGVKIDFVR